MNGPDATAGSILNLVIINGIKAPSVVDTNRAMKIDPDVTIA